MKSFKKVMAGMLMGIMVIGMLTGCGGDPVADDFEKFLNTDMVDVNANYDKIKEESAKWGDLETNEEIKDSINNESCQTLMIHWINFLRSNRKQMK